MRICVTGSIATDHLMTFPGRFADSLIADALDKVSLSFLVDDLDIRRGGVAANICFGMGGAGPAAGARRCRGLGLRRLPLLAERHGVDTESVHVSDLRHTARFVCTTDRDQCQIASFYAGAMSEARRHRARADRSSGSASSTSSSSARTTPTRWRRHTEECRYRGSRSPRTRSQQLARLDGHGMIRS